MSARWRVNRSGRDEALLNQWEDEWQLMRERESRNDAVRSSLFVVVAIMSFAMALAIPPNAVAAGRASRSLRSLSIEPTSTGWDLELQFDFAIRYLRHSPVGKGQLLRILIDPIDLGTLDRPINPLREILSLPSLRGAPILEIAYDSGLDDEPFVEIQFARRMSFEVTQGEGFRNLKIRLRDVPSIVSGTKEPTADASKSFQLLTRAKRALRDRELSLAISLLTKVLETKDPEATIDTLRESRELLGLAHERGGQEAHARAEYETYLAEYPEGPASDRVRQRLEALITAASAPHAPLKSRTTTARVDPSRSTLDHDVFGSLALTYFRSESMFEEVDPGFLSTNVLADVDLASRVRDDDWEVQTDFTGTYDIDVAGEGRSNDLRISRLSVAFEDRLRGYALTLGRQRRSDSGVLGRFDGLSGSYRFGSHYAISALVGLPVTSTSDSAPDTETILAGGAFNVEDLWAKGLRAQLFVVGQNTASMMDRTAIGGDIRYSNQSSYSFVYVDYDLLFNSLNTVIASNTYYWRPDTDFRILVDRRNSPVLTLATALQGQTASDLDELRRDFSESEIRRLALDRTFVYWTGTIGGTHRPNEKLQVSADFGVTYSEATDLSIEDGGIGSTGPDYNASVQLLINDWLVDGGVGSVSVRYFEGETSRSVGTSWFSRFLVFEGFRLSPRLRWDWRDSDFQGGSSTLRPSLEADWRFRDFVVNADAGIQWLEPLSGGSLERETSYFVEVGVRWQF